MLHSGYEASAVDYTFSLRGVFATVRAMLGSRYPDPAAQRELEATPPAKPLVQIAAAPPKPGLQGAEIASEDLAAGVEQAFDYRGDVTIRLKTGADVEGYVFDRARHPQTAQAKLRILSKSEGRRLTVKLEEIERLTFSGRDMADGRSWEAWAKKYAEKKAAGEKNIELTPEAVE